MAEMTFDEFIDMAPYALSQIGKALLDFVLPIIGIIVALLILAFILAFMVNHDLPGKVKHCRNEFRTNRRIAKMLRNSKKAKKRGLH